MLSTNRWGQGRRQIMDVHDIPPIPSHGHVGKLRPLLWLTLHHCYRPMCCSRPLFLEGKATSRLGSETKSRSGPCVFHPNSALTSCAQKVVIYDHIDHIILDILGLLSSWYIHPSCWLRCLGSISLYQLNQQLMIFFHILLLMLLTTHPVKLDDFVEPSEPSTQLSCLVMVIMDRGTIHGFFCLRKNASRESYWSPGGWQLLFAKHGWDESFRTAVHAGGWLQHSQSVTCHIAGAGDRACSQQWLASNMIWKQVKSC